MNKYDQIKGRYQQGMITDDQLQRYVALEVITQAQADEIRSPSNPTADQHSVFTDVLDG